MGWACSMYGGEAYAGFWWGNMRERVHLGDPVLYMPQSVIGIAFSV